MKSKAKAMHGFRRTSTISVEEGTTPTEPADDAQPKTGVCQWICTILGVNFIENLIFTTFHENQNLRTFGFPCDIV